MSLSHKEYDRTTVNLTPEQRAFIHLEAERTGESMKDIIRKAVNLYHKDKLGEKVTELYLQDLEALVDKMTEAIVREIKNALYGSFYKAVASQTDELKEAIMRNSLLLARIVGEMDGKGVDEVLNKYTEQARKVLEAKSKNSKERV